MKHNEFKNMKHSIDLISEKDSSYRSIYNLSVWKLSILWEYIQSSLDKNWIASNQSSAEALILFTSKKNSFLQFCVDYKDLNALTIKNHYSLSLIRETIDQLASIKIFTHLNLQDAYHCIQIQQSNEWKTVFCICYDHFEYHIMFFDLINASAIFQVYINCAMTEFLDVICIVYLNDILIYSCDLKKHAKHI